MRIGNAFVHPNKLMLLLQHMKTLIHMKSANNMVVIMVDDMGIGRLLLQGVLDFPCC